LAGSCWGTLLDSVLPESLLVLLLLLLLCATTVRTLRKGLTSWAAADGVEGRDKLSSCGLSPRLPLFPARALGLAAFSWTVVLLASLARGGHGAPSLLRGGVECGSLRYWALFLLAQAALGALALLVRARLGDDSAELALGGCGFGDLALPLGAFVAGCAAGALGIGGGLLVAPLLLELGCEPRSVAATGAFVVLVADSSVLAQYAIMGLLPAARGAQLAATAFAGTALGQVLAERVIARTGRGAAVVTLLIAATIACSTLAMSAAALMRLAAAGGGSAYTFRSLC
jgi:uncharacterized membrane protein YfcA